MPMTPLSSACEAGLEDHYRSLDDLSVFLEKDGLFHAEIAATCGNPIYLAVCEAVFGWLEEFHIDMVRLPGSEHITLAEHKEIFEAIEARDPSRAARAMEAHLTRSNELYRQFEPPDQNQQQEQPRKLAQKGSLRTIGDRRRMPC